VKTEREINKTHDYSMEVTTDTNISLDAPVVWDTKSTNAYIDENVLRTLLFPE